MMWHELKPGQVVESTISNIYIVIATRLDDSEDASLITFLCLNDGKLLKDVSYPAYEEVPGWIVWYSP